MNSANHRRNAFTIVEVAVTSVLMAIFAVILLGGWDAISRGTIAIIARAQVAQEMDIAVAALCRDLGGCLTNSTGMHTSFPQPPTTPNTAAATTSVILTLDNNDTIEYKLDATNASVKKRNNLVRIYTPNGGTATKFTVARNVDLFQAVWDPVDNILKITINFSCNICPSDRDPIATDRNLSIIKQSCVLMRGPSSPATVTP